MATKKPTTPITINLYCEKCGREKISVVERNGQDQKKTVLPTTKHCPKCRAEYCSKCFAEMKKCYCCGKMIEVTPQKGK